jgi:hypothetical protein
VRAISKLLEYGLVMSFFAMMLIMSIFTGQMQLAYAGGKSPYESGYDHGCDDADISDPNDRYINQPEKGPSFHTDEFMSGYHNGFDDCSEETDDDDNDSNNDRDSNRGGSNSGGTPQSRSGWNWVQICNDLQPALESDCSQLVRPNNVLTSEGERAVTCMKNGFLLAGGGMLLNLPIWSIIPILQGISEPTGCGGIVNWDLIGSVSNLKGIIGRLI